mgnify:CR=1 FL=1
MSRHDYHTPASREFWDFLSGGSSPLETCQHCGRTVFCPDSVDITEEELNQMMKDENSIPDRENDAVFFAYVMGFHCVYGCPCNAAGRLEAMLKDNREWLARWLRTEHKRLQAEAAAVNFDEPSI